MRTELIERIKDDIINNLSSYLRGEGITLRIAANDNVPPDSLHVALEAFLHAPLTSDKPITELQVFLSILGKHWNSETLLEGLYQQLSKHQLTVPEISVLLTSMHVESVLRIRPGKRYRKAVMRYVLEENELIE